jgi:hypothetical protein
MSMIFSHSEMAGEAVFGDWVSNRKKPVFKRAKSMRARRKLRMASMEPPSPWRRVDRILGCEQRSLLAGEIGRVDSFRFVESPCSPC